MPRSRRAQRQPAAVVAGQQHPVAVAVVVLEHAQLAVHQLVLVVVDRLDDAVADAQPGAADAGAVGVQQRAQAVVERVDPRRPAVHRRQHLDARRAIDPEMARQAAAGQGDDLLADRVGALAA